MAFDSTFKMHLPSEQADLVLSEDDSEDHMPSVVENYLNVALKHDC